MVEITQTLLAHGADVHAKDRLGLTVLGCAFTEAPVQLIDVLLAHGLTRTREMKAVYRACIWRYSRQDAVPVLLERGANVNSRDRDRQTPLHEAVWQGDVATVALLIAHEAPINTKDKNGDTPVHIAALIGDVELYNLLAAKGANVKEGTNEG